MNKAGIIFRVQKGRRHVYLLGTIHIPISFFPKTYTRYSKFIEARDNSFFELCSTLPESLNLIYRLPPCNVHDIWTPTQIQQFYDLFQSTFKLPCPIEVEDMIIPLMIICEHLTSWIIHKLYRNINQSDPILDDSLIKKSKKCHSLDTNESMAETLNILCISEHESAKQRLTPAKIISGINRRIQNRLKMAHYLETGNLHKLEQLVNTPWITPSHIDNEILSNAEYIFTQKRNNMWMNKILPFVRDTRSHSTVAVGVAHLLGPGSLIQLFEDNGYIIEIVS